MNEALDNPVWHALIGDQQQFAVMSDDGTVAEYQPDVTTFSGVDAFTADTWERLKAHFGTRPIVTIRAGARTPPDGWRELFIEDLTQYVADDAGPVPDAEFISLGSDDVPDMLALTKATEPGPFLERTHELGHYIGLRRDGELVAMAGERMRTDSFSEISGVCVADSARREGLGGALTTALVHHIHGGGREAMLHVRDGNEAAHALYQRLGFRKRALIRVGVWRWGGA